MILPIIYITAVVSVGFLTNATIEEFHRYITLCIFVLLSFHVLGNKGE